MKTPPIPSNEFDRVKAVYALDLLDTPPEERFDQLTRCATKIFHVPISTLTLVNANREWYKSCQGLQRTEEDKAISFCAHALVEDEMMVIEDALKDERFSDNPLVTGEPHIRFYAGVPIMNANGYRVGVFCIKDTKPRRFSRDDRDILDGLAKWAQLELNSRNLSLAMQDTFFKKFSKANSGKNDKK